MLGIAVRLAWQTRFLLGRPEPPSPDVEFEVLDRLAAGTAKRVQELAGATHLSQSALSRTVARLEKDGLVNRAMCPDDRRGVSVCLTPTGLQRYEAACPTHRRVLEENL